MMSGVDELIRRGTSLKDKELEAGIKALSKVLRDRRQIVKIVKSQPRKDTKDPSTIRRVEPDWQTFAQQQPEYEAIRKRYKTSRDKHGPESIATYDTVAMQEELLLLTDPQASIKNNNVRRRHYDKLCAEKRAIGAIPDAQQHRIPGPPRGAFQPIVISAFPRNQQILQKRRNGLAGNSPAPAPAPAPVALDTTPHLDFMNMFAHIGLRMHNDLRMRMRMSFNINWVSNIRMRMIAVCYYTIQNLYTLCTFTCTIIMVSTTYYTMLYSLHVNH